MRLILPIFFFGHFLTAQNLVVNPGFEESISKKSGLMVAAEVEGWTAPTKGTTDYIRPTSKERKEQVGDVPSYAHIIPYDGRASAGFHGNAFGYEYLCGTLTIGLIKDSVYTISFALATAFDYEFDPQRIGLYFTQESNPFYRFEKPDDRIPVVPNVTCANAEVISVSGHWTVYSVHYTATGTERRFIIGDFTDKFKEGMQGTQAEYFFLDSVYIGAARIVHEDPDPDTVIVVAEEPTLRPVPNDTLIAPGKTLTLENIYFETNKSRILPESYQPLYDIIIALKLQPNLNVEIVGHTDKHGDPKANQKLSEERAKAVADFFISKGIDPSRITTRGEGQSKPVSEEDQKNRRVEFIFTE